MQQTLNELQFPEEGAKKKLTVQLLQTQSSHQLLVDTADCATRLLSVHIHNLTPRLVNKSGKSEICASLIEQ